MNTNNYFTKQMNTLSWNEVEELDFLPDRLNGDLLHLQHKNGETRVKINPSTPSLSTQPNLIGYTNKRRNKKHHSPVDCLLK